MITLPPPLQEGVYVVTALTASEARETIAYHAARQRLQSRVTFQATADLLTEFTGVVIPCRAGLLPSLRWGDLLLQAKLGAGYRPEPGEDLDVDRLEFLLVEYEPG